MLVQSPPTLHYPITVTSLAVDAKQIVARSSVLFSYSYESKLDVTILDEDGNDEQITRKYPADFRADVDGTVLNWRIKKGDIVARAGIPLVEIDEPCKHEIQFAGMCTACGKDMTQVDFVTTVSNEDRATINMVHGNVELKISEAEARRANEATTRRLLKEKKLSLVVDLDQTVIQATCDPTVADWQKDGSNPNFTALENVKAFELNEDKRMNRICSYFIKPRTGLSEFLGKISESYELHIYTMGTRSYAENVAKIIDADGKFFGDRILSRDENGPLQVKNLSRLFPVDTKMVVIIDDRGDVWSYSPNLVRVRPFDFFIGIGDINSSFLPDTPGTVSVTNKSADAQAVKEITASVQVDPDASIEEQVIKMMANANNEEQSTKHQEEIIAQVEERPLLKEQEKLDHEENTKDNLKHPLLQDDDKELEYLQGILTNLHEKFYNLVRGPINDDLDGLPDIKILMPNLKKKILSGVHICFTGLIPQGTSHRSADISRWAQSFGATVSHNLTRKTSHVVADKERRTNKVRLAAKHSQIIIVDRLWLFDTFSTWKRQDEEEYRIVVETDSRPVLELPDSDQDLYATDNSENDQLHSPVEDLRDLDWDGLDAELDDFLDGEEVTDTDSVFHESDSEMEPEDSVEGNPRKRKLGEEEAEEEEENENNLNLNLSDAINSENGNNEGDNEKQVVSRLQQRKKRALERTSSLTKVYNANTSTDIITNSNANNAYGNGKGNINSAEEDDLEAEMLAVFESDE